jgi:DNA-binding response OmpR family regulator
VPQFTATEQRILKVLADGRPHTVDELLACLEDSQAELNALLIHIFRIRRKMRPHDQHIRTLLATKDYPTAYVHVTNINHTSHVR